MRNGTVTFLRSCNRTSAGIMQINERVWREIYAEESLRWDIRDNPLAGCEIHQLYLTKYALTRVLSPEGDSWFRSDNRLAQAVYAMYHAGATALGTFLKRPEKGASTNLDRLFNQRFTRVQRVDWQKLNRCY
jgi:hypothetical protein